MDPDPAIFIIDLQDANKEQILCKIFSAYYFLKVPEPDPYIWLMDPDPGGPKTCGSIHCFLPGFPSFYKCLIF